MSDKLLSVEEAAATLHKNILDACYDDEDILALISAVRHEQDLIATKRERERAVALIDSTLKIPFENYLDVQAVKKKILEEK